MEFPDTRRLKSEFYCSNIWNKRKDNPVETSDKNVTKKVKELLQKLNDEGEAKLEEKVEVRRLGSCVEGGGGCINKQLPYLQQDI